MNKKDLKLFLKDIGLGLFILISTLFLFNINGVFEIKERSLGAELIWRDLVKKGNGNTAEIVFSGNSLAHQLNPNIIDSITQKPTYFFGFRGASIYPICWFYSNSWDYINPKLVVLESHSFMHNFFGANTRIDSIRFSKWMNESPRFSTSPIRLTYTKKPENPFLNFPGFLYENKEELLYLLSPFTKNYALIESNPDIVFESLFPPKKDLSKGFRRSRLFPISDSLVHYYNNGWIPYPDTSFDPKVLQKVEGLIREFKSRGINVLIYESPMYYKHFKPQVERRRQIEAFSRRLDVPFIDLNLDSSLVKTTKYFENTTTFDQHLTAEGADRVSKILAHKIMEFNLLSTHETD